MEMQLTIQRLRRPLEDDPEELMDYLLRSLGLQRNIEVYRKILMKLVNSDLRSAEIAQGIGRRTTTIYHINKLMRTGLVVKRGSRYELREPTFERIIEEIRRDVERVFEDLLRVARALDKKLNLPRRW